MTTNIPNQYQCTLTCQKCITIWSSYDAIKVWMELLPKVNSTLNYTETYRDSPYLCSIQKIWKAFFWYYCYYCHYYKGLVEKLDYKIKFAENCCFFIFHMVCSLSNNWIRRDCFDMDSLQIFSQQVVWIYEVKFARSGQNVSNYCKSWQNNAYMMFV